MPVHADSLHRLTLADLGVNDIAEGKRSRNNRRFACPIHGGDHQLSLSIVEDGPDAGVGYCHACKAKVVITDWPGRASGTYRPPTKAARVADLLTARPAKARAPANSESEDRELSLLRSWRDRMAARVADDRALAYLAGRGLDVTPATHALPCDAILAHAGEVGYIPSGPLPVGMERWADRLIFPLWSPAGIGYAGRALWGWQPGMDEYQHKALLDERQIPRWLKTSIAGWYGPPAEDLAETIWLVEGPLDRLALLSVGIKPHECIALVGTALQVEWLPRQVERVILALDGDAAGQQSAADLAYSLRLLGIETAIAVAPDDGLGKDASERYRRGGLSALGYLFAAYASEGEVRPSAYAPSPAQPLDFAQAARPELLALDPALMCRLFAACPWFIPERASNAALQAACWVTATGYHFPSAFWEIAATLARAFAAGDPVEVLLDDGQRRRVGLPLYVKVLRDSYRWQPCDVARA